MAKEREREAILLVAENLMLTLEAQTQKQANAAFLQSCGFN